MDAATALASLQKAGTEQNRKTYLRHGAPEPMYGVGFTDLRSLAKKIKVDHDLAIALWSSGNTDARILAAMVADPARLDHATASSWITDSRYYVLIDEVAGAVARSPLALTCMAEWVASDDEWIGRAGWAVMSLLAAQNADVPDASFTPYIAVIERRIGDAKNRAREAMNRALIAIGSRSDELAGIAVAAAQRIGPVDVDHGDTSCRTPDAAEYIEKVRAYRNGKAAAKTAKRPAKKKAKAAAKAAKPSAKKKTLAAKPKRKRIRR
jgi:3-methyladenine DNA glycosylase AlkD